MKDHIVITEDGLLKFHVSDPLEEYRVQTILSKEPETIQWIDMWSALSPCDSCSFWDVGSNIGIYTLYAAIKYPNMQIMSFEPFFKNFVRLTANIHLNNLGNVIPFCIALSDNSGLIDFCGVDDRFGASGNVIITSDTGMVDDKKAGLPQYKVKETVLQVSGNDLLKLNLGPPNYLKIDVDGLELGIVEGMRDVLKSEKLKSILIEINSQEDLITVKNLLSSFGFVPDDNINLLEEHSRKRRAKNPSNTAENWVFTKTSPRVCNC